MEKNNEELLEEIPEEVEITESETAEPISGIQEFEITDEQAGTRIDKLVSSLFNLSRARVADLIADGKITANQKAVKASYKPEAGDQIIVDIPEPEPMEIKAEEIPLDVIYEDEDVIVVNKPSGMVVHPSPGHTSGTLVNALLAHCDHLSGINGVMRPGIVHRIDKDTSGLLVVAKNDMAHQKLSEQLSDKTCNRQYLAIVHHPFSHKQGTINAPIGRDPKDRQKMAVTDKNSKEAVTHFEVLENFKDHALVLCKLETGRTHQIRVHMSYIDHPIAGDPKYGYKKTLPGNGQYLHAALLEFVHPRTGEKMSFEAVPEVEFSEMVETLRNES